MLRRIAECLKNPIKQRNTSKVLKHNTIENLLYRTNASAVQKQKRKDTYQTFFTEQMGVGSFASSTAGVRSATLMAGSTTCLSAAGFAAIAKRPCLTRGLTRAGLKPTQLCGST